MKKIIIIAFVALASGFASSCTKDTSVKPAAAQVQKTVLADKNDVGNGD